MKSKISPMVPECRSGLGSTGSIMKMALTIPRTIRLSLAPVQRMGKRP
jgi:hypothetical protein